VNHNVTFSKRARLIVIIIDIQWELLLPP
jgi:hypothetical protein